MLVWLLILFSVFAGVIGQISMKFGTSLEAVPEEAFSLSRTVLLIVGSPWVLLGLFAYAISAVGWVAVLSRTDLSYAYPFVAIGYVLVTVAAKLLLHETIPVSRWIGVGVICTGILIVAISSTR